MAMARPWRPGWTAVRPRTPFLTFIVSESGPETSYPGRPFNYMNKSPISFKSALVAVLFACSFTVATAATKATPAPDVAPPMPARMIDSLDGPVTANELAAFGQVALAYPLPTHNHHNNLVYGRSHEADDLLVTMYELTGDRIYLNRLIEFSDAILACRNN